MIALTQPSPKREGLKAEQKVDAVDAAAKLALQPLDCLGVRYFPAIMQRGERFQPGCGPFPAWSSEASVPTRAPAVPAPFKERAS